MTTAPDIRLEPAPEPRQMQQWSCELPWPPGKNALFANNARVGRVKTARYRKWIKEAGQALLANGSRPHFDSPVAIQVRCHKPTKRKFDPDGRLMAVIDLLVRHGIIPDDSDEYAPDSRAVVDTEFVAKGRVKVIVTRLPDERE